MDAGLRCVWIGVGIIAMFVVIGVSHSINDCSGDSRSQTHC